jgi:hypothetical protein
MALKQSHSNQKKLLKAWRWRYAALTLAAAPLFQATGCFPDPIGALNFELQQFFNLNIISAIDTIVRNVLGL